MNIIGLYFSGTGNTRHCVECFVSEVDNSAKCFSIDDKAALDELSHCKTVIFGFPIYYSNIPKIVKDFIETHADAFKNKKIYIIVTKGLFNAYGVGYAVKHFKNCEAEFVGSLQLVMPDNIRDVAIMELAFSKSYANTIRKADRKVLIAAAKYRENRPSKSGLSVINYLLGALLRALWFYPNTDKYIAAPKVDLEKCTGCGRCEKLCPMQNISIVNCKAVSANQCTVCYRCFNNCHEKALTILGNKAYDQYNYFS